MPVLCCMLCRYQESRESAAVPSRCSGRQRLLARNSDSSKAPRDLNFKRFQDFFRQEIVMREELKYDDINHDIFSYDDCHMMIPCSSRIFRLIWSMPSRYFQRRLQGCLVLVQVGCAKAFDAVGRARGGKARILSFFSMQKDLQKDHVLCF